MLVWPLHFHLYGQPIALPSCSSAVCANQNCLNLHTVSVPAIAHLLYS